MNNSYDVIVIGAGPAGCSAAYFLAERGFRILLLDKERFPRDKVCGDGVSPAAVSVLNRMGVSDKIARLFPWESNEVCITSPDGSMMRGRYIPRGELKDFGYVLPRIKFDQALFKHVQESPLVKTLEDCRFRDFICDGSDIVGVRADIEGAEIEYKAPFIIGADGANSAVARKLGCYNTAQKHRAFAVRAYFNNVEGLDHNINIHYDDGILPGYGWIFPTGEKAANIGVGIMTRFKDPYNIRKMFDAFINGNRYVKEKLRNAEMVEGSFKGWPMTCGSFPSKRYVRNVLLVGDAGSFIDTLTGEGIYYALRSGEYASEAVAKGLSSGCGAEDAGRRYKKLWQGDFQKDFRHGYVLQSFMTRRIILNTSVKRASKNRKHAEIFAGVISHAMPKIRLIF